MQILDAFKLNHDQELVARCHILPTLLKVAVSNDIKQSAKQNKGLRTGGHAQFMCAL